MDLQLSDFLRQARLSDTRSHAWLDTFELRRHHVLIQLVTPEGLSNSGLYLALSDKLPKYYGVVRKVGSAVEGVVPGDRVIVPRYAGEPIATDNYIFDEADVLCTIKEIHE